MRTFQTSACRRRFFGRCAALVGGMLVRPVELLAAGPAFVHLVKRGDTLWTIAESHGMTVSRLKALNGLSGDVIHPGQRLRLAGRFLPPGVIRTDDGVSSRWKNIILHHSATANGNASIFGAYHRRHGMKNGLAYHFVIGNGTDSGDGEIEAGTRWKRQIEGGHVGSLAWNRNSIGICLVGNFEKSKPTANQLDALVEIIDCLNSELPARPRRILLHREVPRAQTVCPGRRFPVSEVRKRYSSQMKQSA